MQSKITKKIKELSHELSTLPHKSKTNNSDQHTHETILNSQSLLKTPLRLSRTGAMTKASARAVITSPDRVDVSDPRP